MRPLSVFVSLVLCQVALADGTKPYTPRLGDYVATVLNSKQRLEYSSNQTGIFYEFSPPNSLQIIVMEQKSVLPEMLDLQIEDSKRLARDYAKTYGWTDAVIEVKRVKR